MKDFRKQPAKTAFSQAVFGNSPLHRWRAFARFIHHCGKVFRVETELLRPAGRGRMLGAVVMLNPGSSRPLAAFGEMAPATLDDSMRAVASVVEDAYQSAGRPVPEGGHLVIFNLFNLCEPDSLLAVAALEKDGRNETGQLRYPFSFQHGFSIWSHTLTAAPWVWSAWGAGKVALRALIVDWEERLRRLPRVGIRIPNDKLGYYHPAYLKRMRKRRPEFREGIVQQIAAKLTQSSAR